MEVQRWLKSDFGSQDLEQFKMFKALEGLSNLLSPVGS